MIDRGNFVREVSIYCYYYYYLIKPLVGIRLISHLYLHIASYRKDSMARLGIQNLVLFFKSCKRPPNFAGRESFARITSQYIYTISACATPRATFVYPRKNTCIFQQIDRLTRRMRLIEREKERIIWKLVSLL